MHLHKSTFSLWGTNIFIKEILITNGPAGRTLSSFVTNSEDLGIKLEVFVLRRYTNVYTFYKVK